jgi:hypothetical protein
MSHPSRIRGVVHVAGALLTLAIIFQIVTGCGDDKKNPAGPGGGGPSNTAFVGVFSNGTENGKITISVASTSLAPRIRAAQSGAAVVSAAAMLSISGGGTQALTGTYNDVTDTLNVSGGGYTFVGEYDSSNDPPSFLGTYTGPNGAGFFGALDQTAITSTIEVYLGTFQSDSTGTSGTFNVARYDTLAGGLAFVAGSMIVIPMDGSVSATGTMRDVTLMADEGSLTLGATGTLDTSAHTMSGTWHTFDSDISKGDDGTWSGALEP